MVKGMKINGKSHLPKIVVKLIKLIIQFRKMTEIKFLLHFDILLTN